MKVSSVFKLFIVISLTIFFEFSSALTDDIEVDDVDSVILVSIVFRHGDRTPVRPYPNDPYKNTSFWPEGFGELTDIGKRQHYQFGRYIRKRYSKLLPEVYNVNDVLVRSTDKDRTLMSVESNLAGLYIPLKQWEPSLNWSPIPVHTVPVNLDGVISMKKPCPKYEAEFKKVLASPEISQINEEHKLLYAYLSKQSGDDIKDPLTLQYLYDTLYVEELKNFTLPQWTKRVYPEEMKSLADFSFTLAAYTKELQRLKGGPLLGDMIANMKAKSENTLTPDRKLFLYSAHDTTVANLMMTLGIFDNRMPPYTAALIVQLHQLPQGAFAVSIFYRNNTEGILFPMQLPGCSMQCPLEQFIELTKPVVPVDWHKECGLRDEYLTTQDFDLLTSLTVATVIGSGIIAVLLVALIVVTVLYYQQMKGSHHYHPVRLQPA